MQDGEKNLNLSQCPSSLLPSLPVWFDFQTAAAHRPQSLGPGERRGRRRGNPEGRGRHRAGLPGHRPLAAVVGWGPYTGCQKGGATVTKTDGQTPTRDKDRGRQTDKPRQRGRQRQMEFQTRSLFPGYPRAVSPVSFPGPVCYPGCIVSEL